LLQGGQKMVLEQAITAVAAIADVVEEKFLKYYDSFMPFLKNVLKNANTKELRTLRGKAMECVSLIGVAVGKQKFMQDAKEVVEELVKTQQMKLDPDDPQVSFLLQAWARVCKAIKEDFVPYLQVVMPPLLASAQIDPDLTISGDDEGEGELEGWQYIPVGDKRIGINTSLMEEKATACNMIYQYAAELKDGFFPYAEQVANILIPLTKFYFHDGVRTAAVSAMPALLDSVKEYIVKHGGDVTPLRNLYGHIISALTESIQQEVDTDILLLMIETLYESVDICGENAMNDVQIRTCCETIKREITEREERMKNRFEEKQGEDFDEEEAEKLAIENEKEEEVLSELAELLGKIAKQHKGAILRPFSECIFPLVIAMLQPNRSAHDRQIALCMLDDIIEFCGSASLPLFQHFLPAMIRYITDENPSVRQAAVFGIGLCAQFGGESMAPLIPDICKRLDGVIKHGASRSAENVHATENAISAVGKICQFQAGAIDVSAIIPLFVSYLPVDQDKIEAKVIYGQLCLFIQRHTQLVFGSSYQNLGHVLHVFARGLGQGLVTDETAGHMRAILRQMNSSLPADLLAAAVRSLPAEEVAILTKN